MEGSEVKNKSAGSKNIRDWLQLALIAFATLWGVYEFVLKDIIRPAQKPTSLELVATLERFGRKDQNLLIRASIEAKNPTDKRIYVPAYWFVVRGYVLSKSAPANIIDKQKLYQPQYDELINTYSFVTTNEIVAQKRITYEADSWWEPQDITHNESVFTIPAGKFDFLELSVYYIHTKDNSELENPNWEIYNDGLWWAFFNFKNSSGITDEVEWQRETGSGYNWYVTTLQLR